MENAHLVYLEFFTGYSNYSCLHSIISNSRMEEACIVLTTVLIFVYPSNSYLGIHNNQLIDAVPRQLLKTNTLVCNGLKCSC